MTHGTVAVQVPGTLQSCFGYPEFVEVAARHAGPEAVSLLSSYFTLGDLEHLSGLFDDAACTSPPAPARARTEGSRSTTLWPTRSTAHPSASGSARRHTTTSSGTPRSAKPYLTADGHMETQFQGHLIAARKQR